MDNIEIGIAAGVGVVLIAAAILYFCVKCRKVSGRQRPFRRRLFHQSSPLRDVRIYPEVSKELHSEPNGEASNESKSDDTRGGKFKVIWRNMM